MTDTQVTLEEGQRQATLLALGHLAVERPGWDYMLGEIAELLHGRELFEAFREMHKKETAGNRFITCTIVK